ncbi:MAG: hypothetical protein HY905_07945 [Deltaproteobacteria bacterium]|nr:hypothetical protein [Deltaproteobacteria bacterium]
MTLRVTILYEDKRGPPPSCGFGLHQLVIALAADSAGIPRHDMARDLKGIPAGATASSGTSAGTKWAA